MTLSTWKREEAGKAFRVIYIKKYCHGVHIVLCTRKKKKQYSSDLLCHSMFRQETHPLFKRFRMAK